MPAEQSRREVESSFAVVRQGAAPHLTLGMLSRRRVDGKDRYFAEGAVPSHQRYRLPEPEPDQGCSHGREDRRHSRGGVGLLGIDQRHRSLPTIVGAIFHCRVHPHDLPRQFIVGHRPCATKLEPEKLRIVALMARYRMGKRDEPMTLAAAERNRRVHWIFLHRHLRSSCSNVPVAAGMRPALARGKAPATRTGAGRPPSSSQRAMAAALAMTSRYQPSIRRSGVPVSACLSTKAAFQLWRWYASSSSGIDHSW